MHPPSQPIPTQRLADDEAALVDAGHRVVPAAAYGDDVLLRVHDPALVTNEMVEDVLKYKRLDGVDAALNTIAGACFAGGRQSLELESRLGEITVPTQVVWGREDRILPVAHSEGLPASIAVTILDGAGHLVHMEKAAEVNALVESQVG